MEEAKHADEDSVVPHDVNLCVCTACQKQRGEDAAEAGRMNQVVGPPCPGCACVPCTHKLRLCAVQQGRMQEGAELVHRACDPCECHPCEQERKEHSDEDQVS